MASVYIQNVKHNCNKVGSCSNQKTVCKECMGYCYEAAELNYCGMKCYDSRFKYLPAVTDRVFLNKPYRVHPDQYNMKLITKENPATCGVVFENDGKTLFCNKIANFEGPGEYRTCRMHSLQPNTECRSCPSCQKCIHCGEKHDLEESLTKCTSCIEPTLTTPTTPENDELYKIGNTGAEYRKIAVLKNMKTIMNLVSSRAQNGHFNIIFPDPIPDDLVPILKEKQITVSEDLKFLSW
ncbi:MAG TPA: hypothetical protein PKD85_01020 [Saprospiraceae bacterium]|nr:hypothetical protein [Saprospiraceae bacterium]